MDYIKEAEVYLRSYKELKRSIPLIGNEIECLNEELVNVKTIDYSRMPNSGGTTSTDDRIVTLLYKKQLKQIELKLAKLKVKHIEVMLNNIDMSDGEILKAFYLDNVTIANLEELLNLSDRQIQNIKKRAIKRVAIHLFGVKVLD